MASFRKINPFSKSNPGTGCKRVINFHGLFKQHVSDKAAADTLTFLALFMRKGNRTEVLQQLYHLKSFP
jgi:hypothetical protein